MRTRLRWVGVTGVVGLLLWPGAAMPVAAQEEGLPIGLPDFPRRVVRQLPDLKPEQEINVGVLKLHPSFYSAVEFDDNVTLAETGEKDDVIFTEKPGVIGEMKLGDHRLEMGYGVESLTFVDEKEDNTVNHLAHGILDLDFDNLQLTVSDTLEDSTNRLFTEAASRDHVFLNTVQTLARLDRPQWALEGGWTHNTIDHKTPSFNNNDYGEDVLGILGGYKITAKTLWLLEYDFGLVNYDHNVSRADHDYWQLLTGLRGELSPKVTSTLKVGFQNRNFSDIASEQISDTDELVADMELVYSPSVSDVAKLGYARTLRTSTYATNNYYRQDKISLSYRKRFANKWLFTPRFSWQRNHYPEHNTVAGVRKRRRDRFLQAGAELRYELREWLSTGFAYHFRGRNSNHHSLDYDNNRYTFDVTLAF